MTRSQNQYARAYLKKSRVKNNTKIIVQKQILKIKGKRKDRIDKQRTASLIFLFILKCRLPEKRRDSLVDRIFNDKSERNGGKSGNSKAGWYKA